jgi:hypothetical protein
MKRDLRTGRPEESEWREVRQLWGAELTPVPAALIGPYISDSTRSFLTKVGLPAGIPFEFTFYRDERFLKPVPAGHGDFLALAGDQNTIIALESDTEELWNVKPRGTITRRFMNSRLPALIYFIGIYVTRRQDLLNARDEEEAGVLVREISEQCASCDAPALADPQGWWSLVLRGASEGFIS